MPKVVFHDLTEFTAELRKDAPSIARRILRTTCCFERSDMFTVLHVLAGYAIEDDTVELKLRIASYMTNHTPDQTAAAKRADDAMAQLHSLADELGLDLRHGSFR